jgi:hypothetical protein
VQLKALLAALALALVVGASASARAQVAQLDTTHSAFYEAPTRTHMFVYTPSGELEVSPTSWLAVRGGWEADIVSGASVATKAGAAYQATHAADVVSTASVHDFRNLGRGGFTLKGEQTQVSAGYAYSTERDYRSHMVDVSARSDAYQHNTQFALSYAHNFDSVCDRVQPNTALPPLYGALEDSVGCFTSVASRTTHAIGIDGFEGSWAQSWTPIFQTQLTYTAQIQEGFLSNPYRAVILGEGLKAQEHHPENRAREGLTLRTAWYLRPIKMALRFGVRGYWDTWDVKSGSFEAEAEKAFGESFRLMLRGRLYKQSGAVFWSDDYTGGEAPLGPKGQYWTADRELSPFWSWLAGVRTVYTLAPTRGRILGIMTQLKSGVGFNVISFSYDQYTLGGTPISNARAYLGTLSLTAVF